MPCIKIKDGFVCVNNVYEYGGFLFEVHSYCGPHPLRKKDMKPYRKLPGEKHKFWKVFYEWDKLSKAEQIATMI